MEKTTQKKNRSLRRIASVRLGIMLFALAAVATISSLRGSDEAMVWVYDHITHPYHVFMSQFCSNVSFSVAELIYAASILGLAAYILWCAYRMICFPGKLWQLYRLVLTLCMAGAVFWAGLTVMWTPCYYAPSFSEQSGIDDGPLEVSELETVTRWFAQLASEYADEVERGEDGSYIADRESVLDRAAEVFEGASELYPFLDGAALAYIYLGNALAGVDYEAYVEVYYSLSDTVRADLKAQSAYWDQFRDSVPQKASNTVYDSFLKSNDQELGMQSYGACVNLLVHYYIDEAREALG